MRNLSLTVAYEGTSYLGWQATHMGPSIESTLAKYLHQILQEPIKLQAASRTDAGVHALGQVVNFLTNSSISLRRLLKSLNALLPKSCAVLDIQEMPFDFHPTINCTSKEYHYSICTAPVQLPQNRHFSWHYAYPLRLDLMEEAAAKLSGRWDFASFCNRKKNETYQTTIREINRIEIKQLPEDRLRIEISGNQFLYKMVRTLVGTLAYVGRQKIFLDDLDTILQGKSRPLAGLTAPAHGLTLFRVFYP